MPESRQPPHEEQGRELHALLLAGDLTATSRIADAYYEVVVQWLFQTNPGERDKHMLDQAASDAFVNLFSQPDRYNPDKQSLLKYLQMSAQGDYRNRYRSEKKRAERIHDPGRSVEEDGDSAEEGIEYASTVDVEAEVLADLSPIWPALESLFPDSLDRSVVILMMDGVRETDPYAIVLGISDLPEEKRAHEVKKVKDRIRRKIQRNLDPAELRNDD